MTINFTFHYQNVSCFFRVTLRENCVFNCRKVFIVLRYQCRVQLAIWLKFTVFQKVDIYTFPEFTLDGSRTENISYASDDIGGPPVCVMFFGYNKTHSSAWQGHVSGYALPLDCLIDSGDRFIASPNICCKHDLFQIDLPTVSNLQTSFTFWNWKLGLLAVVLGIIAIWTIHGSFKLLSRKFSTNRYTLIKFYQYANIFFAFASWSSLFSSKPSWKRALGGGEVYRNGKSTKCQRKMTRKL